MLRDVQILPLSEETLEEVYDIYNRNKIREFSYYPHIKSILPLPEDAAAFKKFNDSEISVLKERGRCMGFTGMRENYLSFLYVDKHHAGKGYGRMLLKSLFERVEGEITLHTCYGNSPALALYKSFGFKETAVISRYFQGHEIKVVEMCRQF